MLSPMPKVGRERDVLVAKVLGHALTNAAIEGQRMFIGGLAVCTFPGGHDPSTSNPTWTHVQGDLWATPALPDYSTNDAHALQALEEWRGQDKGNHSWRLDSRDGKTPPECTLFLDGDRECRAGAPTIADAATQALVRTLEEKRDG